MIVYISGGVDFMPIKDSDTRFLIQTSKETKDELMKIAKEDNRSLTNLINHILLKYLKERKGESK